MQAAHNNTFLLLLPQNIGSKKPLLQLLLVKKGTATAQFDSFDLHNREIKRYFAHLTTATKDCLMQFTDTATEALVQKITQKHASAKAGITLDAFLSKTLLREQYALFESLLLHAHALPCYHKIWLNNKRVSTRPIHIENARPQFGFSVVALPSGGYEIQISFTINGQTVDLSNASLYHFFLHINDTYYLIRWNDYQTINWLVDNHTNIPLLSAHDFKQTVLAKLEQSYPVNRNGHFPAIDIATMPTNRVMLSELSGSFLMLTPQWLYESFLIEGNWQAQQDITKGGDVYTIHRNQTAESDFLTLLRNLHPNFTKQNNGYFYLSYADAQKKHWFLKTYHLLLDQNIELAGMDMLQHFRYSAHKAATTVQVVQQLLHAVQLHFVLQFGTEIVPLLQLQKMLLAGQRAILLKDGSLGILTDDWLQEYGTIVKHGRINKQTIEVAKWMAMHEASNPNSLPLLQPTFSKEWWHKWQQWQNNNTTIYPIPALIQAQLRPYQQKGFEWMALLAEVGAGACLADDMGLGKTLQTICLLAHLHQLQPNQPFLIACPASLMYNWQQELQKFAPHFKLLMYHGAQRNFADITAQQHHVIITTYGTLRADIALLCNITFGAAVVDESHNIKNPSALITKALSQIQAHTRVALSGTPVMNNTFDLYAQLSYLLPGMFGSRDFFKKEYADPIDREQDLPKIQALQKLTAPFILRRTKEQVATDLPDKMESILWCTMGHDQQAAYDTIKEQVRNSVFLDIEQKGLGTGKLSVINGLLKLRQVCNSCQLVQDEDLFTSDSIKTEVLIAELRNLIPHHKVLVFSQFTTMLGLLATQLQQAGMGFLQLDGSTPIPERQQLVNRFQDGNSPEKVFLISLKAGNAGLNLTAADYVFLFDPWWNTAVQQQAIDRTHRIGQTKQVFAYQMICKNTIEEKIMQLQDRKKKLAEELIGEEAGFIKSLSENDIEFLFS